MEYRGFVIRSALSLIKEIIGIALIWVILDKFHAVKGWTIWEVVFLYGLKQLVVAIYAFFFDNAGNLDFKVINGELDRILIRPLNPLFHLFAEGASLMKGFSSIILGPFFLVIASYKLGLDWTVIDFLMLLLSVLGGVGVLTGVSLSFSSIAFWTMKSAFILDFIFVFREEFLNYPLNIYGKGIQFMLSFILPLAFINYFPSCFILDKTKEVIISPFLVYLSPLVGILTMLGAYQIWKFGLKNYASTGT